MTSFDRRICASDIERKLRVAPQESADRWIIQMGPTPPKRCETAVELPLAHLARAECVTGERKAERKLSATAG
jgi:hypothetical protein